MVSEISLGSWMTYGGAVAREQAEACVARAFELGIDFIDTANVYSGGSAEELLRWRGSTRAPARRRRR
jgi:aryl-alcohol dehydrogenase-like predicted oxidoreductase